MVRVVASADEGEDKGIFPMNKHVRVESVRYANPDPTKRERSVLIETFSDGVFAFPGCFQLREMYANDRE